MSPILIIDNYDSFTFNLYQQIARISGKPPLVVPNDRITAAEIKALNPSAIIVSPGPGRPGRPKDFGVCRDAILETDAPLLGVCLGHQGIAHLFGGSIYRTSEVKHGRTSRIFHDNSALFEGLPQGFKAVRYHSLAVSEDLPCMLEKNAWTEDGIVMALSHRSRPLWGIQFHPESICTEYGDRIIENFLKMSGALRKPAQARFTAAPQSQESDPLLELHWRKLDYYAAPEDVFVQMFAGRKHCFWLDSSLVATGLSRYSFMGAPDGPRGKVVYYSTKEKRLSLNCKGEVSHRSGSLFDFLKEEIEKHSCRDSRLPFDFNCGFVGYFGYEMKAECGSEALHRSPLPDAAFIFADRALVFDHAERAIYLLALGEKQSDSDCQTWLDSTEAALGSLEPAPPVISATKAGVMNFTLARSHEAYISDIESCLREIAEGESYEICLTNRLHAEPLSNPLDAYRVLRRINPAPYSAYLKFDEAAILSSSPELFLKIDQRRQVTTRPIKGTAARLKHRDDDRAARSMLARSEKERAENLMIVDLLRNDLGRVCEIGSVCVPSLMQVESYATLHQLVTTIRGRLKEGVTAIDCLRAAFPGGSMTGAPKIRTMQIIDRLEQRARGVYSGSLGFLSLNGSAELNIVIRTIVAAKDITSIGVGGAITALSDPQKEFEETLLKAEALIRAMVIARRGDFSNDYYSIAGLTRQMSGRSNNA